MKWAIWIMALVACGCASPAALPEVTIVFASVPSTFTGSAYTAPNAVSLTFSFSVPSVNGGTEVMRVASWDGQTSSSQVVVQLAPYEVNGFTVQASIVGNGTPCVVATGQSTAIFTPGVTESAPVAATLTAVANPGCGP